VHKVRDASDLFTDESNYLIDCTAAASLAITMMPGNQTGGKTGNKTATSWQMHELKEHGSNILPGDFLILFIAIILGSHHLIMLFFSLLWQHDVYACSTAHSTRYIIAFNLPFSSRMNSLSFLWIDD